ncbi:hypothetical protein DFQ14_1022 [Halopolyspora algeriensis]|uniref:Uncharacterized protein n=1 Tax=Halopolyspora algeriensis TaxID=1500506 RepID=A0A368VZC5_9ACTN|nr:hypothetical protein [Halopolyspora algeriensis]RCW45701.1 hypothetical protein DFQ14_1022 [Halopolyspora algeriensis]TQM54085.1 hypothetical protein FHU43_2264 [Halopolyspora algeriensis]
MSSGPVGFGGPPALVPQELRGYRRFLLTGGNLWPPVHADCGPWDARLERATCGQGSEHAAPDAECGCGLYGWYHPSRATRSSGFGDVSAVIAARGRIILGEDGFRAAGARIEAVTVPTRARLWPGASHRIQRLLAERYPQTVVYRSRRRMLRDHPAGDLRELGITVRVSTTARYVRSALGVWVLGVLALCSAALLLPTSMVQARPAVWATVLGGVVLWQALLIWLAGRCSETPRTPPPR